MKKIIVVLLCFCTVILMPLTAKAEFEKAKIAVLDFQLQGQGYNTADMGKIVAEWLITALVREGRFEVVERRLLQKVLEEQKLVMAGVVDENSATELGKLLGVKVIISGSVLKFQNILEVNARIIDVESASIITAESVKSSTAIRLEDLVVQMAEKIIKDFPLEGYVVSRNNDTVVIDLGKRVGVKNGMKFIVYKEGKLIKHPKTGEILDVEKIRTGEIEVRDVTEKISNAKILQETSPDTIKYGQMVKSTIQTAMPIGKYSQPAVSAKPTGAAFDLAETGATFDLAEIDQVLAQMKQLKETGDARWEIKYKQIVRKLKTIYVRYPKSPEVLYYYAKVFYAADNPRKANKSLEKAVHYDPDYVDAYVLMGDINYEVGTKVSAWKLKMFKLDQAAANAFEAAAQKRLDKNFQALMYFKIGLVYDELTKNREKAKEYWQKAVSTATDSEGARLAGEKLQNF